jgi:uncharacterized repeat protein (TIGR01451 family)
VFLGALIAVAGLLAFAPQAFGAQQVISSSGPLTSIFLNDNLACQVAHSGDTDFEFYQPQTSDPGDCGTEIAVPGGAGSTVYGQNNFSAGNSYVPYNLVSQSPVTGMGSAGDPFKVVTVVDVPTTNLRITQADTYVVGQEVYDTQVVVSNSGGSAQTATLYHTGDCFLQNSDAGFGFFDSSTGGIFCTANANNQPSGRVEGFIPGTPGNHYVEGAYPDVWDQVSSGEDLPDTCDCTINQDNMAALSWAINVPADGQVTESFVSAFSPTGVPPGPADLSITKDDSPDPVHAGTHLTYTLTVANHGPSTAHGVAVHDALPAGTSFVSASASAGSCSGTTTVDCAIGDLANGASATVTVVVTPSTAGSLSNTATVSGAGPDPDPSNNSATADTTVLKAVKCQGPTATIVGTPGNDNITGTPGNDVIAGQAGNDTINGLGGNDKICGKEGNDKLTGAGGNDKLHGGPGRDKESGGNGKDLVKGGGAADKLKGNSGKDNVRGGSGKDQMSGGGGPDLLKAHGGGDAVQGNGGNDKLGGGAQFDHLNGGAGKNVCSPGPDGAKLVKCTRGKV